MPITSNTINNDPNRSGNMGTTGTRRTFRTGNSTITLREGETLKGVVSDVHGNEITISLDDGTSFTGHLPEASMYSIGQKAAFLITSLDNGTIYMKAMSSAYLLGMEDTIEQALEEAGLPKSPRNYDIVRSLLENKQSISRESINTFMQLCSHYPNADVGNVITMYRLGFSMDEASVTQFDTYQNQQHQLLSRMDTLTDSLTDLLSELSGENASVARYAAGEILSTALGSTPSLEEFQLAARETLEQQMPDASSETVNPSDAADPTKVADLSEATDPAKEVDPASNNPLSRMRELFSNITDKVNTNLAGTQTPEEPDFIQEQSGHILSASERESLADSFSRFTDFEKLLANLRNGSATARELLGALHSALPNLSDPMIRELFANPSIGKLIKAQFLSNWTISPDGLKEGNGIDSLYHKISSELDELLHLSQMFATRSSGETAVNTTSDMQQNLQFMKTLNEQFNYMQLPLKLSSENAHGDLYVMTKKEALRKSKDNLKVLLHLEMDHLGPLDIHITKERTNISTKFYIENNNALRLLEKNINLLKDSLNNQGYTFSSEFEEKKKDIDLVHDFIETEAPVGNITRYNFDLRA
ncbi:MAG: flagellar hook-length control protein FliK [Eubacterium sp.]